MATPNTSSAPEPAIRPPSEKIFLPDMTPVHIHAENGHYKITINNSTTIKFSPLERSIPITPDGMLNEDRLVPVPVLQLHPGEQSSTKIDISDVWAGLYGLWIRNAAVEGLPLSLENGFENVEEIRTYLVHTGLAFPAKKGSADLVLVRSSFWQAAGAPPGRAWLRTPIPHPSLHATLSAFPRPPKPSPGSVIYQRFICTVNQMLTFTHINASDPDHFVAYTKWQNSDRVNVGWREKGPDEKHRAYLKDRLEDPHIMGFIVSWNGEPAGYGEMSWVKEDGMGTYVGGLGDYDQGTHLLVGEEKFRGKHRFTAIMVGMKHACFLRDPRTQIVVGEPRADLPIVPLLKTYLPQEFNRVLHFTFDCEKKDLG